MNILNYDIKKTKLFKKIMISICSMIMVFASCFAPYSKVKALVGIDDVALSYVALSVLGLCGITLAGTTLSNTDITKLGSEVAGSISRTFDTLGKTVSDKWNLLVQTAGATGKIALDYVNDLKGNIQDWWNSLSNVDVGFNEFTVGMGGITLGCKYFPGFDSKKYPEIQKYSKYPLSYSYIYDRYEGEVVGFYGEYLLQSTYEYGGLGICLVYNGKDYYVTSIGNYTFNDIRDKYADGTLTKNYFTDSNYSRIDNLLGMLYYVTSDSRVKKYGNEYNRSGYTNIFTVSKDMISNMFTFATSSLYFFNTQTYYLGGLDMSESKYTTYFPGFGLDSIGKSSIPDSFKLDDRVLGETGALSLSDKIIGAVGSLDLDLTNNVVNSYGYVDVPSTTLDYPYTGTWDSTLDGIGAIAWAPSTDIPIADTNVIAPTLPGTTDTDIPKVKDFTGKGTDLSFDWKGVFPFCIPFDLIKFIQCFCADPEAPKFEIPVNIPKIYKGDIKVDLSGFDEVAALCRTLFDILFIIGLAYATRYLIKG